MLFCGPDCLQTAIVYFMMGSELKRIVIIGAGPAGLTAAHELCRASAACTVFERDSVVGGLSRTIEHDGFRFDIGGHRFYTKVAAISQLWEEVLGDDFLRRPRLSRIYYKQRFFDYPLKAGNVLSTLGPLESTLCIASYIWALMFPVKPERCFEDWVVNRFGRRLYRLFFKSYTEKVWGISCREIQAEWASQRIQSLSLWSAARNTLFRNKGSVKTLIDNFRYPRLGPGMMWERFAAMIRSSHGQIYLDSPVTRIFWQPGGVTGVEVNGQVHAATHVLSSLPIRDLIQQLDPKPPAYLTDAIRCFHYRDFLTVALFVRKREVFPDNWIYVQDGSVKVGRIQNFKNWSPDMAPRQDVTCLGMEYFCFEGDDLWNMTDSNLIALAASELKRLGFASEQEVDGGRVVRVPKAYPVYDSAYQKGLGAIRRFQREQTPNLQLIGRNGMHHYNNQDHSMLTGMLAARNALGASYDLWQINTEEEYLEASCILSNQELDSLRATQPRTPGRVKAAYR